MRSFNASAGLPRTLAFAFLALAAVLLLLLLLRAFGMDWAAALRDASLSKGPQAGLISNIGIVLMMSGAIVSAVAWAITRSPAVLGLGLFCFVFAADDGLMLHERVSDYEVVILAAYFLGFVLVWRQLALLHQKSILWPLALVVVAFAASVAVDLLGRSIEPALSHLVQRNARNMRTGLEDIPKAVGIVCLALVTVNEALDAMRARSVSEAAVRSGQGTALRW